MVSGDGYREAGILGSLDVWQPDPLLTHTHVSTHQTTHNGTGAGARFGGLGGRGAARLQRGAARVLLLLLLLVMVQDLLLLGWGGPENQRAVLQQTGDVTAGE